MGQCADTEAGSRPEDPMRGGYVPQAGWETLPSGQIGEIMGRKRELGKGDPWPARERERESGGGKTMNHRMPWRIIQGFNAYVQTWP